MKSAVVLLPGLNRDRDMIAALTKISGQAPATVWQTDTEIPDVDLIVIPGGFSYGDYLRCGAIAARMPVMRAVAEKAAKGVMVMGVCAASDPARGGCCQRADAQRNAQIRLPRGQARGRQRQHRLRGAMRPGRSSTARRPSRRQLFRRCRDAGADRRPGPGGVRYAEGTNPNGSINDIAGIVSKAGNVLGLMPHPENLIEAAHGGDDGRALFEGVLGKAA